MNLIIELIIKIFQVVFEKDTARRTKAQKARPQRPQEKEGKREASILADLFAELQGTQQQVAKPVRQKATAPPPVPVVKKESLDEHLRARDKHYAAMEQRGDDLARGAGEHLGYATQHKKEAKHHAMETLPGKTALEQMIVAGIILGPCKARQSRR